MLYRIQRARKAPSGLIPAPGVFYRGSSRAESGNSYLSEKQGL